MNDPDEVTVAEMADVRSVVVGSDGRPKVRLGDGSALEEQTRADSRTAARSALIKIAAGAGTLAAGVAAAFVVDVVRELLDSLDKEAEGKHPGGSATN